MGTIFRIRCARRNSLLKIDISLKIAGDILSQELGVQSRLGQCVWYQS